MLPEVGPYFWTGTGKLSSANSGNLPSALTADVPKPDFLWGVAHGSPGIPEKSLFLCGAHEPEKLARLRVVIGVVLTIVPMIGRSFERERRFLCAGPLEALRVYRDKDVVEKCFDDLKNLLDMRRLRMHSIETVDGRLFVQFIALILMSERAPALHEGVETH